jgi:hypothetical protein
MEHERRRPDWRDFLGAYARARARVLRQPTERNLELLRAGEEILYRELVKPGKFDLGQMVMTPRALDAMEQALQIPPEFLLRHKNLDWGELGDEDEQVNEWALAWEQLEREGRPIEGKVPWWVVSKRLFSRYSTRTQVGLYVITAHNRSATTILLPDEY